jgi:hypothetical protein
MPARITPRTLAMPPSMRGAYDRATSEKGRRFDRNVRVYAAGMAGVELPGFGLVVLVAVVIVVIGFALMVRR